MTNRIHIFDDEQGKSEVDGGFTESAMAPQNLTAGHRHSVCLSSDVQGCTVAAASRMGKLRDSFYVSNKERPTWSLRLGRNDHICASLGQCGRER